MLDLKNLSSEINLKIQQVKDRETLESLKTLYLGKKGIITEAFKSMGKIDADERKNFASELNIIKSNLLDQINSHQSKIELKEIEEKLNSEEIDITLPTKEIKKGKIHPVSQVIDELTCIFAEIGFSVAEGPDIENEFNNFTALNTPEHHPARDMHDTFYLDEDKKTLLRTHTSPVQIRTMLNNKPPIKIIAPGRTYRCDSDMTHTPMFHQLEGLHIGKDINMGHLKGCLDFFLKKFFCFERGFPAVFIQHFPPSYPMNMAFLGIRETSHSFRLPPRKRGSRRGVSGSTRPARRAPVRNRPRSPSFPSRRSAPVPARHVRPVQRADPALSPPCAGPPPPPPAAAGTGAVARPRGR